MWVQGSGFSCSTPEFMVSDFRSTRTEGLPIGSKVVLFWGLPYRILNIKPQKGTILEPMGRVE